MATNEKILREILKSVLQYDQENGECLDPILYGKIVDALASTATSYSDSTDAQTPPEWVVNSMGELGVKINCRFYFLYKGENIEYEEGLHDNGDPILWRLVGKREFGETCWPLKWVTDGKREDRYTQNLEFISGLSFGKPEDFDWRPLPAPPIAAKKKESQ